MAIRNGNTVVCQPWVRELGGKCHPNGYSLHLNERDRSVFVQIGEKGESNRNSRPQGSGYPVQADRSTLLKLLRSKEPGLRFSGTPPEL